MKDAIAGGLGRLKSEVVADDNAASGEGFRQHLVIGLSGFAGGCRAIRFRKHEIQGDNGGAGVQQEPHQGGDAVARPGPASVTGETRVIEFDNGDTSRCACIADRGDDAVLRAEFKAEQVGGLGSKQNQRHGQDERSNEEGEGLRLSNQRTITSTRRFLGSATLSAVFTSGSDSP